MTQVEADRGLCEGYLQCVADAPEIFDVDDEGVVVVLRADVAPEQRMNAVRAVANCPARALRLVE